MLVKRKESRGEAAEILALGALDWLLGSARSTAAGLTWATTVPCSEADSTLYHGSAGIVLALLEAQQHFGDDRYGDAAIRGAAAIAKLGEMFTAAGGKWESTSIAGHTANTLAKLRADVVAGNPPPAVQLKGPEIVEWNATGMTLNLDDIAKEIQTEHGRLAALP